MVTINQITRKMIVDKQEIFPGGPTDYDKFLVISIGTGSAKDAAMYTAKDAAGWGILSWLHTKEGYTPIVDMFSYSSAAIVDYNVSILFQALRSEKNYLRIQVRYSQSISIRRHAQMISLFGTSSVYVEIIVH
jgi:hypothetical protein